MTARVDWAFFSALAGLLGALTFAFMWSAAVVTDGHWILGQETLSELGGDRPGRSFFNAAVITEGILGLIFSSGIYRLMKGNNLGRLGSMVFFIGAIALIGVGIFPITTGSPHTVASYAFFGLMLIALLLMIAPIFHHPVLGKVGGVVTIASLIVSLGFLFAAPIPPTEAVAVICLLIWSSAQSLLIIFNRRKMGFVYISR